MEIRWSFRNSEKAIRSVRYADKVFPARPHSDHTRFKNRSIHSDNEDESSRRSDAGHEGKIFFVSDFGQSDLVIDIAGFIVADTQTEGPIDIHHCQQLGTARIPMVQIGTNIEGFIHQCYLALKGLRKLTAKRLSGVGLIWLEPIWMPYKRLDQSI